MAWANPWQSCAHRRLRESPADHALDCLRIQRDIKATLCFTKHNFDDRRVKRKGHP